MKIIDVQTLHDALQQGKDIFLLDVREQSEWDICHLPNGRLIPLGQISQKLDEIPKDVEIVAYCHHGGRSARAVQLLQSCGYDNVSNLQGGVEAWALRVDPEMPRY